MAREDVIEALRSEGILAGWADSLSPARWSELVSPRVQLFEVSLDTCGDLTQRHILLRHIGEVDVLVVDIGLRGLGVGLTDVLVLTNGKVNMSNLSLRLIENGSWPNGLSFKVS